MLDSKIKRNLTEQLTISRKIEEARNKLNELEHQRAMNIGALRVLSELYEEANGKNLQNVINTDPEWKKWINELQSILPAGEEPQIPVDNVEQKKQPLPAQPLPAQPIPSTQALPETPKLRKVGENKKVPQEEPKIERTRPPVTVVITDGGTSPVNENDDNDTE